jgi:predicted nucleic acid-binding Zn ribbon protein
MSTRSAGDILKELFASMRLDERKETLFDVWPSIVGEEAAEHLRIKDIKGKTLTLSADHPGWIQVARLKKNEILEKIKERFPDKNIDNIKISLR